MRRLYHITSRAAVRRARRRGEYRPDGLAVEGFIHASYKHQLLGVAAARFAGVRDLVLLEIDPALLSCEVVDENLEGGEMLFPHIYGPVPMRSVVAVHPFPCGAAGGFELPRGI